MPAKLFHGHHIRPFLAPYWSLFLLATMVAGSSVASAQQPPAANQNGCVGFCATLSAGERATLASWVHSTVILGAIEDERDTALAIKTMGYGIKTVGYAVSGGAGGSRGAGPAVVSVASNALQDLGNAVIAHAERNVAERIVVELNKTYTGLIDNKGKLNRDILKNVTQSSLQFLYQPGFQNEVGAPELIVQMQGKVTADQLSEVLKDTTDIKLSASQLNARVKRLNDTLKEVKKTQSLLVTRAEATQRSVAVVDQRLARQETIMDSVAKTLPKPQLLALVRAGAVSLDATSVQQLEQQVSVEALKGQFDAAAGTFAGLASGLQGVGLGQAARTVSAASSVISNAGAFAVAWSTGNPLGTLQAGMGLLGSVKAFGATPQPSVEVQMLGQVLQEIRALSMKIDAYHAQEMQMLNAIASRLAGIDSRLQREFGKLFFDVALLQGDVRELLSDATRTCGRLMREVEMVGSPSRVGRGFATFGRWFDSDGRNQNYVACIEGLLARLEVGGETRFSGLLHAQSAMNSDARTVGEKRAQVRVLEQGVLEPTAAYVYRYSPARDPRARREALYAPRSAVCDLYSNGVRSGSFLCQGWRSTGWTPGRIDVSEFNPGGGALLSPDAVLELARYSRVLGPWDMALTERIGAAAPSVMSETEAQKLSRSAQALRTRHLAAMRGAADALDLAVAQAQLLAGVPVLLRAVEILESEVLPSYALARLRGDMVRINELLAVPMPDAAANGPNCATGKAAYDTLCLMQSNEWFASNVITTLLAKRLEQKRVSYEQWRRLARLSSAEVEKVVGSDVLVRDASISLPGGKDAIWAIELPRVNVIAIEARKDAPTCWEASGGVKAESSTGGKYPVPQIDKKSEYYKKQESSVCHVLPQYAAADLGQLSFPYGYGALLAERAAVDEERTSICAAVPEYPRAYCESGKATGR